MSSSSPSDFIKKTFDELREMSALQQILVGGTAGLATGYVLSRVGKLAAFSIGSSVLLLQVAQHLGYIEIRWNKKSKIDELKKKALKAAEESGLMGPNRQNNKLDKVGQEIKKFLQNNVTFGISFGSGVLIGFSI